MQPHEPSGTPLEPSREVPMGPPGSSTVMRPARLWACALVGAALAALGAWAAGEGLRWAGGRAMIQAGGEGEGEETFGYYKPTMEASSQSYSFAELNRQKSRAIARNATVAFGLLGASLGLALGLAGGVARGSITRAAAGGVAGLVLGAALGALPSPWIIPYHYFNQDPSSTDLAFPMLIHGGLWLPAALAGGLALGVGLGGGVTMTRAALGGLVGGMIGILLFDTLGSLAFYDARTLDPFSITGPSRLIARLAVALGTAVGGGLAVTAAGKRERRGKATA